jgi:hypothetical protein
VACTSGTRRSSCSPGLAFGLVEYRVAVVGLAVEHRCLADAAGAFGAAGQRAAPGLLDHLEDRAVGRDGEGELALLRTTSKASVTPRSACVPSTPWRRSSPSLSGSRQDCSRGPAPVRGGPRRCSRAGPSSESAVPMARASARREASAASGSGMVVLRAVVVGGHRVRSGAVPRRGIAHVRAALTTGARAPAQRAGRARREGAPRRAGSRPEVRGVAGCAASSRHRIGRRRV